MTQEFIPYEQALELKELGFDEPCLSYYDKDSTLKRSLLEYPIINSKNGFHEHWNIITAPLYQQAFRWFREKHQISPSIHCMSEQGNSWRYHIPNEGGETNFSTYEEAELACLIKLIEIVKNKQP